MISGVFLLVRDAGVSFPTVTVTVAGLFLREYAQKSTQRGFEPCSQSGSRFAYRARKNPFRDYFVRDAGLEPATLSV